MNIKDLHLLPIDKMDISVEKEIIEELHPLLNRIAMNPTIDEANGELDKGVKKLLAQ